LNDKSRQKLNECHPDLIRLFEAVEQAGYMFVVATGYRGKREQNRLHKEGKSQLAWPHSMHNKNPSLAVDVYPMSQSGSINWGDKDGFYMFGGFVLGVAFALGVELVWGGDWDSDHDTADQYFNDLGHFELLV
jgi:peptidoglycan L-alanyl-D-glutamate endopeptidase CwlK